jgi:PBP1b-binding outer membrane lipoprotein LpoB
MKKYFMVVTLIFLLEGCHNYPKDSEDTLKKITNDTLRVGYSENPPWVTEASTELYGIEVTLIKEFAAQHHTEVKCISGQLGKISCR